MRHSRLTTATAAAAVIVLAGSVAALGSGDPTPIPAPRTAFVARGDGTNFADALAIGSIAGQLGAPVFTTPATSLAPAARSGLVRYQPELVIIAGGTAAISAEVEAEIKEATGLSDRFVGRAGGRDRYETAAIVAGIFEAIGTGPAFLPIGATATDADLLDGFDSTAFQRVGHHPDVLAAGQTMRGYWRASGDVSGEGQVVTDAISFPVPLPATPSNNLLLEGETSAECPGPTDAAPGHLCLYVFASFNVDWENSVVDPAGGPAATLGVDVALASENMGGYEVVATWAVTAAE